MSRLRREQLDRRLSLGPGLIHGAWHGAPSTPFISAYGSIAGVTSTLGGTSTSGNGPDGAFAIPRTTASSGNAAGYVTNIIGHPFVLGPRFAFKVRPEDLTSVRMFVGAADQTLATMVGADQPTGNDYIGLQYSTPRGDTTWRIIRNRGGTVVVTDTGVTVSAVDPHTCVIEFVGSTSIRVVLFDDTGAQVYSTTFTTTIPVLSFRLMAALATQTTAVRGLCLYAMAMGLRG